MNVLLAFGRLVLAHREKAVLVAMMLLCGGLALATRLASDDPGGNGPGPEIPPPTKSPRTMREYPPARLTNPQSWDFFSRMLERRGSPFRPSVGGGAAAINARDVEAWPEFRVKRVSQPTAGGVWIAQLEIDGRAYIARENGAFAGNQYELQRIDKTRGCVEVLRRLDDEVREFCQE